MTNGDLVAWDSASGGIRAWRPTWKPTVTLLPSLAENPPASLAALASSNDLGISGRFLTWDVGGNGDFIMDLETDSIAALTHNPGEVALSGTRLQFWECTSQHDTSPPGGPYTYSDHLLNLGTAPDLPRCSA